MGLTYFSHSNWMWEILPGIMSVPQKILWIWIMLCIQHLMVKVIYLLLLLLLLVTQVIPWPHKILVLARQCTSSKLRSQEERQTFTTLVVRCSQGESCYCKWEISNGDVKFLYAMKLVSPPFLIIFCKEWHVMMGEHLVLVNLYHDFRLVLSKKSRIGDTKYHS